MFNIYPIEIEVKTSVLKVIDKLRSTKLSKEDKLFVNSLSTITEKEQLQLIYNIVSIGYSSVQTFIDKEESISVPYLGTFKYIEGKRINKEVSSEILHSNGFKSFKDILDENIKQELNNQIKTTVKQKIKESKVSNPFRGKGNVVLPFTLKIQK